MIHSATKPGKRLPRAMAKLCSPTAQIPLLYPTNFNSSTLLIPHWVFISKESEGVDSRHTENQVAISRWLREQHSNPFRSDGGFKSPTKTEKTQDADPHREPGDKALTAAEAIDKGVELYKDFMSHPDFQGLMTPPSEVFSAVEQPGESTIHLDLASAERQLMGNLQDLGLGILGGILKPLSQYLARKAMQPFTIRATLDDRRPVPTMPVIHDFQHMECVREWFTTVYEDDAREVQAKIHPAIGVPGFQYDGKRGLYVVGEFA